MEYRKIAIFLGMICAMCSFTYGQTPTPTPDDADAAKKQKEIDEKVTRMLDQSIVDATSLRVPTNRAVVYSMTGDLYWKYDTKRSRELFRSAAGEIVASNQEAAKEKTDNTQQNFGPFDPTDVRTDVITLIATHDAELALELLLQTRTPELAAAVAKYAQADTPVGGGRGRGNGGGPGGQGGGQGGGPGGGFGGPGGFNADMQRAAQEIAFEQRLKALAALADPDKAITAIKESLAKGISTNVIPLLQTVYDKDDKKALDLAGDVVKKILDADLTKTEDLNGTMSFLQSFAKPASTAPADPKAKVFAFTDSQIKDIANKLANFFLQPPATPQIAAALTRSLTSFGTVLPEKIALLTQRDAQNKNSTAATTQNARGRQNLFDPNATPEDILAAAAKMANERDRTTAYQAVASRTAQIADPVRAKKLIDAIPDDTIRSNASAQFDAAQITRLAAADKLDEARRLLGTIANKKTRIQKMVATAAQYQKKGGDSDLENAKAIMVEAKGLVNPYPEDEDELADLMEVVRGFAIVEPDTAFRLFEPIVDQFNEIIQATAVLSKYNKRDRSFKKGEMLMRVNGNNGGLLLFRYIPQLQVLGKADLDRMSTLVDRFGRPDTRAIVKLYVLQGFLLVDPPVAAVNNTGRRGN